MKWQEVRELYPEQFVKFEIVESHIQNEERNKKRRFRLFGNNKG